MAVEQNELSLDEARAKAAQLGRTFALRRKADAADIRALEITARIPNAARAA